MSKNNFAFSDLSSKIKVSISNPLAKKAYGNTITFSSSKCNESCTLKKDEISYTSPMNVDCFPDTDKINLTYYQENLVDKKEKRTIQVEESYEQWVNEYQEQEQVVYEKVKITGIKSLFKAIKNAFTYVAKVIKVKILVPVKKVFKRKVNKVIEVVTGKQVVKEYHSYNTSKNIGKGTFEIKI